MKTLGLIICGAILVIGVWGIISEFIHIANRFDIDERSRRDKR